MSRTGADDQVDVLLERDGLLSELSDLLGNAADGSGRLAFVAGEAGVGKTALVRRFARTLTDARVRRGVSDSPTTAAPLGPFLDALGEDLPELADPPERRVRLFAAVRAMLGQTTTVLVLEDLHWADTATLDLLGYLGRRLEAWPVLLVATYRDDEVGGSHPLTLLLGDLASHVGVVRTRVPPLTVPAVRMLADAAGSAVDADELHRRTGGNAFYVTEILGVGDQALPASVRDATLARAARLSVEARRVLDAAAVIATGLELELVCEVSRASVAAIDECYEKGLLVGLGPRLEFRHELARVAVEQAVPLATRARLHATALAWLTEHHTADDRRLAYHAEGCGDGRAVLIHAPRAAERASRLGAHLAAAEHYEAALRHASQVAPEERAALLERLSYERYVTDQPAAAVDSQLAALAVYRTLGDTRRTGAALRLLSRLTWFLGRADDAWRYAEEALAELQQLPAGTELAMAYSNLSQLSMVGGDTAAAVSRGSQAIELARQLGDRATEAHALNNVGAALMTGGRTMEGATMLSQSLGLALAIDAHEHVARAYTNLGSGFASRRRFAEADRYLRAGLAYCAERDLGSWQQYMSAVLATLLVEQGQWDEAQDLAVQVLRRPGGSLVSRIPALLVEAEIHLRRGDDAAEPLLEEAAALAQQTGEAQRLMPVVATRLEAAWLAGRNATDDAVQAGNVPHASEWERGEVNWWAHRAGVQPLAADTGAEPFDLMLRGRSREAADYWAAAGSPWWQALALVESDDSADVRNGLEQLRGLGAVATVAAVLRDLHAAGRPVPRGPRPTTRAHPAGLTDRELEVLSLLGAGLSNADIARALFLSPKTAGHHVSAVLRKLGEPTRSRAVAAAVRRGILPL